MRYNNSRKRQGTNNQHTSLFGADTQSKTHLRYVGLQIPPPFIRKKSVVPKTDVDEKGMVNNQKDTG
jgi:hypothetical protein